MSKDITDDGIAAYVLIVFMGALTHFVIVCKTLVANKS